MKSKDQIKAKLFRLEEAIKEGNANRDKAYEESNMDTFFHYRDRVHEDLREKKILNWVLS